MPRHLCSISRPCVVALSLAATFLTEVFAQEENPELAQAEAQYRKDIEFATKPIRDRYLSRLDVLKRQLGARGETRAALAVQEEMDRVLASIPDENLYSAAAKLAGTWKISYSNGDSRTYAFSTDGHATFFALDLSGKITGTFKKKMFMKGGDVLVEFQEGAVERLKISGGKLQVEHFNPKTQYPKGQPAAKGTGVPVAPRKP
jgi:hypothetical protein